MLPPCDLSSYKKYISKYKYLIVNPLYNAKHRPPPTRFGHMHQSLFQSEWSDEVVDARMLDRLVDVEKFDAQRLIILSNRLQTGDVAKKRRYPWTDATFETPPREL